MKIFNTAKGKKVPFKPFQKEIKMYVCGPTVQGPAHIGHARTYIAFDIIRRYLEWKDFKVRIAVNITDVHDDMISKANQLNTTIFALAEKYIKEFHEGMQALGIKKADFYPRVTEEINSIIKAVELLEKKGFAYETNDGVYFDISKFKGYGKLSGIKPRESVTGTRVETDKYDKRKVQDFALWKKSKPNEPFWNSPWGKGRPGWHIECSVMSSKYLGLPIDIHGGGMDLVFPHHENEIAQSEAAFEKPFVLNWLHSGFLNVEGQKMSKSLGNFITVPELLEKNSARTFRFFIATKHYRSRINFSEKEMVHAENTLKRLDEFIQRLHEITKEGECPEASKIIKAARRAFEKAMDDDFNLPLAWSAIFRLEKQANKLMDSGKITKKGACSLISFLESLNSVLGVFETEKKEAVLDNATMRLIEEREKLRREKKFREADEIREKLKEKGIELIDAPGGVKWRYK